MVIPWLRYIWSKTSSARLPLAQRTTRPSPTTSQQVAPRSSTPTRKNGCCGVTGESWLNLDLSLETQFEIQASRARLAQLDHDQLKDAADRLVQDWHLKAVILDQAFRRIAELECCMVLSSPPDDERYLRWADEVLAGLGEG